MPAGYDSDHPTPLILAFHGRGESAKKIEGYSRIADLPAIGVFPDGQPGSETEPELGWQGAPYSSSADDVAFVRDLLDHLERTLCVDSNRVYATGKSNGGGFTSLLACRLADRIAAIASVAGAYYAVVPDCRPSRPVAVLEFHGTDDPVIAYDGNVGKGVPSIPSWLGEWAKRDGCTRGPTVFMQDRDITASRWSECSADAEIEHYRIDGGGHTWPGATIASGPGETTHSIRATAIMWRFFGEHPRRR